jgi:peptidoglycan/LPS O-acetylase OafA/YrhL
LNLLNSATTGIAASSYAYNSSSRLVGLDVLRFLATSIVLCGHANNFGEAGALFQKTPGIIGRILLSISGLGWVAVDIFFVLSGFLVSGLLFKEAAQTGTVSVSRFLIRRGFKIYPAFWVMIAVTVVWTRLRGGTVSFGALCGELLYFQNYGLSLCFHTWSLAVEEHFYFLLAGLFLILKWRTGPDRGLNFRWIPNFFLTLAVLCLVARTVTWAVFVGSTNVNLFWFIHADHALLDSLFFGVMLSHFWHNEWSEPTRRKVLSWRALFAVTGLCLLLPSCVNVMDVRWFRIFGFILIYLGAGCLLLSSLSLDYFPCPAFVRWLAWLGKYSYSVYLWHLLAGDWLTPLLRVKMVKMPGMILNALIYVAGAWAIGIVLARLIEFPVLRCRDRWFPSLSRQ